MTEPTSPTPPPPGGASGRSNQSLWSLILGILGIVCCGLLAPVAWYLGNQEIKAINEGRVARENEGMAKAGMILGIIGTVLLVFALLWVLFFGGLGVLGAFMDAAGN